MEATQAIFKQGVRLIKSVLIIVTATGLDPARHEQIKLNAGRELSEISDSTSYLSLPA
ncbi:MAG: hypothetical protein JJU35_05500 [Balneolales bacterium]|nr:hypothetical protein [Balneolales bacterium]